MAASNTESPGGSAGARIGMGLGIASLYFGLSQAFNGVNMSSTNGQKLGLISQSCQPSSSGSSGGSATSTEPAVQPTVYIFHDEIANPDADPIKTALQMQQVAKEMQSIVDQNGIKMKIKIITEAQSDNIEDNMSRADAMVRSSADPFLGEWQPHSEGNTSTDENWGGIQYYKDSCVDPNTSVEDLKIIKKNGGTSTLEKLLAYKMAHEVLHQYWTMASVYAHEIGKTWIPGQDSEYHDNGSLNLNMDGDKWRADVRSNPTQKNIRDSKMLLPAHKELIKNYLDQLMYPEPYVPRHLTEK